MVLLQRELYFPKDPEETNIFRRGFKLFFWGRGGVRLYGACNASI